LPDQTGRTFLVSWSGQDDPGGSGIASYDILVSTNRIDYRLWLIDTTSTNAFFTGDLGTTYSFFSVARDAVGYVEAPPAEPDASTTVSTEWSMDSRWEMPDLFVPVPITGPDTGCSSGLCACRPSRVVDLALACISQHFLPPRSRSSQEK